MTRVPIDTNALGITPEDLQTAARVAVAMHRQAARSMPNVAPRFRNQYATHSTIKTLLEIGGVKSQKGRGKEWQRWLHAQHRCTVQEACDKWEDFGLAVGAEAHHGRREYALRKLREMAHDGLIRYICADKGDPGLVVWIGDAP
jgi:hypothetical protein